MKFRARHQWLDKELYPFHCFADCLATKVAATIHSVTGRAALSRGS